MCRNIFWFWATRGNTRGVLICKYMWIDFKPKWRFSWKIVEFHSNESNENTMERCERSIDEIERACAVKSNVTNDGASWQQYVCNAHFTMTAPCLEKREEKWFDLVWFMWMCERVNISQSQKTNNEHTGLGERSITSALHTTNQIQNVTT